MPSLVELKNAMVRYSAERSVGPFDLQIEEGDFWGIVGPNGAGKSTLLRAISGQQAITGGEICWNLVNTGSATAATNEPLPDKAAKPTVGDGHPGSSGPFDCRKPPMQELRRRIGVLLQRHGHHEEVPVTVGDIVAFGRLPYMIHGHRCGPQGKAAVRNAMTNLGLDEMRHRLYRQLSGGEKQKVQIARLLAQESPLCLLDEPTAGLDIDWQERVTRIVHALRMEHHKTILMVTHDIDRLPASCNKVLLIRQGQPLAMGKPEDIFTNENLTHLYGCPMEVDHQRGRWFAHPLAPA